MPKKDYTGQKYGSLVALEYDAVESGRHKSDYWKFKCDCGNTKSIQKSNVVYGRTRSCGCMNPGCIKVLPRELQHGLSGTRPYICWVSMIHRCREENSYLSSRYKDRGISVCEKWQTFEGFWEDMKDTYTDNLTLDRKNNDGNYCKENCRWATTKQQSLNKESSNIIEFNGERKTVTEFCQELGIDRFLVYKRLEQGWEPERALTEKPKRRDRVYYIINGVRLSRSEVSKNFNINESTIRGRIKMGWDIEKVISTPVEVRNQSKLRAN